MNEATGIYLAHLGGRRQRRGPFAARAQSATTLRVGMVGVSQNLVSTDQELFLQRLAELGYQEGKTLDFQIIYVTKIEDYAPRSRELVARGVDVLTAIGTEMALKTALDATKTVPNHARDRRRPDRSGLRKQPGGRPDRTGIFLEQIELTTKRLQVVKDDIPRTAGCRPRSGIGHRPISFRRRRVRQESPALSFSAASCVNNPTITTRHWQRHRPIADRPFVTTTPSFFRDRAQIAELALRARMPSAFAFREWVDAGGLLSYGPSVIASVSAGAPAEYVDPHRARALSCPTSSNKQPTTFESCLLCEDSEGYRPCHAHLSSRRALLEGDRIEGYLLRRRCLLMAHMGDDPVRVGDSLNRPDGNSTGVEFCRKRPFSGRCATARRSIR